MIFRELKLQSSHISELISFYSSVLEMEVKRPDEKSISILAGQSILTFTDATETRNPFYHFAFNIPSNKFEEAFQWIKKRCDLLWLDDYKSYVADFVNWNAKSVYFLDPAGNILELIARFDLNNDADELFSSVQFLNISEIGLVFPGEILDTKASEILDLYGLSYFSKQPPLNHFKAIGNDEGLFIAVTENRNWFATKMASAIFPIEVSFINNNNLYELKM